MTLFADCGNLYFRFIRYEIEFSILANNYGFKSQSHNTCCCCEKKYTRFLKNHAMRYIA